MHRRIIFRSRVTRQLFELTFRLLPRTQLSLHKPHDPFCAAGLRPVHSIKHGDSIKFGIVVRRQVSAGIESAWMGTRVMPGRHWHWPHPLAIVRGRDFNWIPKKNGLLEEAALCRGIDRSGGRATSKNRTGEKTRLSRVCVCMWEIGVRRICGVVIGPVITRRPFSCFILEFEISIVQI